ncbi:MAG: hypothetical protein ACR2IN_01370 [Thermoleophilaceae bacterium]
MWWVNCFGSQCPKHGDYLRALIGALGLDLSPSRLLDDPLTHLVPALGRPREARRGPDEDLPSDAWLAGARERLRSERRVLRWLRRERGLSRETVERYGLGYTERRGTGALVLPASGRDGGFVTVKFRFWPELHEGRKTDALARPAALYPSPPRRRKRTFRVVLCEGELDALRLRQAGIAAVTATCGTQLPDPLADRLARLRRPVAVLYDVGNESRAEASAAKLRAAGADAWACALPLDEREADVTDWFNAGRTARELRRLIRAARREAI